MKREPVHLELLRLLVRHSHRQIRVREMEVLARVDRFGQREIGRVEALEGEVHVRVQLRTERPERGEDLEYVTVAAEVRVVQHAPSQIALQQRQRIFRQQLLSFEEFTLLPPVILRQFTFLLKTKRLMLKFSVMRIAK
jgi:hypothetical protein